MVPRDGANGWQSSLLRLLLPQPIKAVVLQHSSKGCPANTVSQPWSLLLATSDLKLTLELTQDGCNHDLLGFIERPGVSAAAKDK